MQVLLIYPQCNNITKFVEFIPQHLEYTKKYIPANNLKIIADKSKKWINAILLLSNFLYLPEFHKFCYIIAIVMDISNNTCIYQ